MGVGKRVFGCFLMWQLGGYLRIDMLQYKTKLKWWCKLATVPKDKYPNMLFRI